MTDDFYDLLDVPPDASQDDIKQAFREQVRVYHPDLNDDERAQAQFTALKKAYDILGDPVERRAYDRLGHEDYVAKRTKGLPSPELWQTTDESTSSETSTTAAAGSTGSSDSGATSRESARSSTAAGGSTQSSTATGGSTHSSAGSAGTSASSAGSTTADARSTGPGAVGDAPGASATGSTAGSGTTAGRSTSRNRGARSPGGLLDNAAVRWWRRQNFAWPLIWASAILYVAGLAQFWLANRAGVSTLGAELRAAGADPAGLGSTLTGAGHGIETPVAFVRGLQPVAPPLPRLQWYGAFAGLVALSLIAVIGARYAWREETWGPVTIDETIVVAVAIGVATAAVGGPLLAGVALMPLLYGVVVRRTRQLQRWAPSWIYVCCVLGPAAGLAAGYAGYGSLATDLLAFVVLPLSGAFGLPLRVTVRKRFGR